MPKSVRDYAVEINNKAIKDESIITSTIDDFVRQNQGSLTGLLHRIKTVDSLERKISETSEELEISSKQAAESIKDSLRYTVLYGPKGMFKKAETVTRKLENSGFELIDKPKNMFLRRGEDLDYYGYHTWFRHKETGQVFELQFHTQETFDLKERIHNLYEEARLFTTTESVLKQLMSDPWKKITWPD
jgi:hypothetical protein